MARNAKSLDPALVLRVNDATTLRPLCAADAGALFALTEANRSHLREWLPWLDAVTSVGDTREFIRACDERARRSGAFTALIETGSEPCGVIGYNWIDSANRACEIGYWLAESHVGRGLMKRACEALITHAFETLLLNRVNIPVAVGNARSRAIPEALGFAHEGVLREAEWLYDHYVDHALYGLLRSDRQLG
jgi:ribosomal-protein-serine acetyltransferase